MLLRRFIDCVCLMALVLIAIFGGLGLADRAMGAPAQTQAAAEVPVDKVARAKFPRAPAKVVDGVAYINRVVNAAIEGVEDKDHYGVDELWVMYPADRKGDCEDYAITKLGILESNEYPVVDRVKLVGVAVRQHGELFGHMILAVRLPGGAVAYLDNRFNEPMTRAELVKRGYIFFDWRA